MEAGPDTFVDLFFGYSALWILVAAFVLKIARDQRRIARELDRLRGDGRSAVER